MKKSIFLLVLCLVLLVSAPAWADGTLNYTATSDGANQMVIEVDAGGRSYGALMIELEVPDGVGIEVSYQASGTYTRQRPDTDSAGYTYFGIYSDVQGGDNNTITGDAICTVTFTNVDDNTTIQIRRIRQEINIGNNVYETYWGDGMSVVLGGGSTTPPPTTDDETYTITIGNETNGTISLGRSSASEGQTVTIRFSADSGYTFSSWTVRDSSGNNVSVNNSSSSSTSFTMPASDVTVSGSATRSSTTDPGSSGGGSSGSGGGSSSGGGSTTVTITDIEIPTTAALRFTDAPTTHWAYSFIEYLAGLGYVNGKTATTFAPSDNITRAEFVTILARMSGETLPSYAGTFTDVDASAYYAQAVAWAVQAGITTGTSATTFSPGSQITRQDIATMLMRYASYKNVSFAATEAAVTFTDQAQISSYASDAVSSMQLSGIISGNTDGTFRPLNNATRAEASKMLALVHNAMN